MESFSERKDLMEETTDISENMKKKLIDFSVDFCEGIPGSLVVISDIFYLLRCSNISENNERLSNLLMEKLVERNINIELGSDQTSLHNPWAGGYYPVGISFEDANNMMANNPQQFKKEVQKTLVRHTNAINT